MNDIFIFDTDTNMSASKYFGLEEHKTIISSLDTKKDRPKMDIRAHEWCQEIVDVRWDILKENLIDVTINVLIFFF